MLSKIVEVIALNKVRSLLIATAIFVSFVSSVLAGPVIYEWYSATFIIQEDDSLTFSGSILGNLTVHYNQTIRAAITNRADSTLTGLVLVEIVNSTDNTVFIAQYKSETILPKNTWNMDYVTWRPLSTGSYRVHIQVIDPEWS